MITNSRLASFSDEDLITELKYRGYSVSIPKSNNNHACKNCKFLNNYPKCYTANNVACEDWVKAHWVK